MGVGRSQISYVNHALQGHIFNVSPIPPQLAQRLGSVEGGIY